MTIDQFLGYLELRSKEVYWNGFKDEEGRCPICSVTKFLFPSINYKINTIEANKYLGLSELDRIYIVQAVDKGNSLTPKIELAIKRKVTYQFAHVIKKIINFHLEN